VKYLIKDEYGEVMRIVGRREEARQLVAQREGWTYKQYRELKTVYLFEEAPF
jgi:hypothetical protein